MSEDNKEFLQWICDRLEFVHHENPKVDYMIKLRKIIENTPTERKLVSCPHCGASNTIELEVRTDYECAESVRSKFCVGCNKCFSVHYRPAKIMAYSHLSHKD